VDYLVKPLDAARVTAADEICCLKAEHKDVAVVTAHSEALLSTPLKELHARLDPEVFWQVHRGTVVNIQAVRCIHGGLGGRLSLSLRGRRETLAVGPGCAHLFRQRCGCLQLWPVSLVGSATTTEPLPTSRHRLPHVMRIVVGMQTGNDSPAELAAARACAKSLA